MVITAAILLGLVFGAATFLPISASGHLAILQNLFGLSIGESGQPFLELMLHLGTLLAVCILYHRDIGRMLCEFIGFFRDGYRIAPGQTRPAPERRLLLMLIISTLFLLFPLAFYSYIKQLAEHLVFIGIALMISGVILFLTSFSDYGKKNEKSMTVFDAAVIGVAQAVAVIPGISHIALTLTVGMFVGLEWKYAVRYSMLLSFFSIFGITIMSLVRALGQEITVDMVSGGVLAMLFATAAACAGIVALRTLVRNGTVHYVSCYCAFFGILTIVLTFVL
ncbi:MAG: undecaprenyl-diphosphate phosphatase [Oscillospiraceae bacterium]|jgi:undecaprenyl-diphosphatase